MFKVSLAEQGRCDGKNRVQRYRIDGRTETSREYARADDHQLNGEEVCIMDYDDDQLGKIHIEKLRKM